MSPAVPSHHRWRLRALFTAALAASGLIWATAARAECLDERTQERAPSVDDASTPAEPLRALVQTAIDRSRRIDARLLIREAAAADLQAEQAKQGWEWQFETAMGPSRRSSADISAPGALQAQAGIFFSRMLDDGGRGLHRLQWRQHLQRAAELDMLSVREQLALHTVAATLERTRLRQQAVVLGHYVRQMSCLIQALERSEGPPSEYRDSAAEARLALQQAIELQGRARQALRDSGPALRHLLGDGLPVHVEWPLWLLRAESDDRPGLGLEAPELLAQRARQAAERALDAARASEREPQVHGFLGARTGVTAGQGGDPSRRHIEWMAGFQIRFDAWPGPNPARDAATAAVQQRAAAAGLEAEAARLARRVQLEDHRLQARRAFETAHRLAGLLRDSGRLRQPTLQEWQGTSLEQLRESAQALRAHYALRMAYLDALYAGQQSTVMAKSLGPGLFDALR